MRNNVPKELPISTECNASGGEVNAAAALGSLLLRKRAHVTPDRVHELVRDRPTRQGGHIMEVELLHDVGPVRVCGSDAHSEFAGNFLVAVAFGNELHDFALARGQRLKGIFLASTYHELAHGIDDTRTEVGASVGHEFNRFFQFFQSGIFLNITGDA